MKLDVDTDNGDAVRSLLLCKAIYTAVAKRKAIYTTANVEFQASSISCASISSEMRILHQIPHNSKPSGPIPKFELRINSSYTTPSYAEFTIHGNCHTEALMGVAACRVRFISTIFGPHFKEKF